MQFKNFLRNGALAVMMASTLVSAFAKPIQSMVENQPDNVQMVQVIKSNIPQEDLAYLIQMGPGVKNDRTDSIRKKIDSSIESKYGQERIEQVKKELGEEIKELSEKHNINVAYSWAIPKKIIEEYPTAKQNDSSIANGSFDISGQCSVDIKLAVDNQGRLFESSELLDHTTEEMSNRSSQSIIATLKETVAHEISHCVLQKQMKDPNFELSFSKEFRETNPQIAKALNDKINDVKVKISHKNFEDINQFDYILFSNYQENFSDVNGAFARLGENPTTETIKEVRDSLISLAKFREKSDVSHQTQAAYQYALENLEVAALMTPSQRENFAKQISSDTLISNLKIVFEKVLSNSESTAIGTYLVGGLTINKDNSVSLKIPKDKEKELGSIFVEYEDMIDAGHKLGSAGQKILTHSELVSKHESQTQQSNKYEFNYDSVQKIRAQSLSENSSNKIKPH